MLPRCTYPGRKFEWNPEPKKIEFSGGLPFVYVGKLLRGETWNSLSIPPGASAAYNASPDKEHARAHAASLAARTPAGG